MAFESLQASLGALGCIRDMVLARVYPNIRVDPINLHGKRALVTGANVGIGFEIAKWTAAQGADVYLLCRNPSKAEAAQKEIIQHKADSKVSVEIVDFSSLASVRDFLDRWTKRSSEDRRIDFLFNNAGLTVSQKETTSEGFELTYVSNFLSHFLLTVSLINDNCFASDARIVSVSSAGAYSSGRLNPDDQNSSDLLEGYEGDAVPSKMCLDVYSRSKAMQVAFTRELQDRLLASSSHRGLVLQSCHPGLVASSIWGRHLDKAEHAKVLSRAIAVVGVFGVSSEQGAMTPLFLATSPRAARPSKLGKFWFRKSSRWPPGWIHDKKLLSDLWARWEKDSGVKLAENSGSRTL